MNLLAESKASNPSPDEGETGAPAAAENPLGGREQVHNSHRLRRKLVQQDIRGEKSIALAQACISLFVLVLHTGAAFFNHMEHSGAPYFWVPAILSGLILSSLLRYLAARKAQRRKWIFELMNLADIAIFLSLLWSYQYTYALAAGSVLKAPSFALLFVLIALRALRLHPVPILTTGAAAAAGWGLLIWVSVWMEGTGNVTHSYTSYLTSNKILIGAEVEKMAALAALTFILAYAAHKARQILSRAADAADYADALRSAKHNQREAEKAQASAEAALEEIGRKDKELTEQNTLFSAALGHLQHALCMFDADKRLLMCNDAYIQMYDLDLELTAPGTPFRTIIERRIERGMYAGENPQAYIQERLAAAEETEPSTKIHELPNGRIIAIAHQPMEDGGWIAAHQDITELQNIEARVAHLAQYDSLTDLANRTTLQNRIEEKLRDLGRGEEVAILCLNLDRFKEVNKSYGHALGDELLKTVAKRLSGCIRESDMVARIGGDEFAIAQAGREQPAEAIALANRICKIFEQPFELDGHQVVTGVCIGAVIAPGDGRDADLLLKNSEIALNGAKDAGSGSIHFFEPEMDARVRARREMEVDLRKALERGQFELHYQPLQSLKTLKISGFEALLRWHHPERGMVSPADFIPLAEEIGLIVPLGEWVIRQACDVAATWPDNIKIAVNVSPVQFRSGNLVSIVMSALASSGIEPGRLELEITESVFLNDAESTLKTMHQLRGLGARIAMDDFGTGYSSLSYLRDFPFDKIKLDGCFVRDLDTSKEAIAIVRAVARLGDSLGMTTTAECVETEEQLAKLVLEGYAEIQGYLFSPARPAAEVLEFFDEDVPLQAACA
ncbi:MAG TPA: EAL domain-containing protein [Rhizobiales bacterium]|nr:EAL domain-containing protein [Hyphomicrobiales bacterium]